MSRNATLAAVIVLAYLGLAVMVGVAPAALAAATPGVPALPLVVTLHLAVFVLVVVLTVVRTGRDAA